MLECGHQDLAHLRATPETRRRSIIRNTLTPPPAAARHINILCVADDQMVADTVKETLEKVGRTVDLCADTAQARRKLESTARYDLLIFDNQLPGKAGPNLARRARELPHRRRTPIIMFSASDTERDVWRAGVNALLRKPQDINQLASWVARLLNKDTTGK